MSNINDGRDRATTRLRWAARIWSVVLIAIALMIVSGYLWNWITTGVADPNAAEDYPPIENIPPLLLLLSVIGLAVAWRKEGLGGTITLVSSLANIPILLVHWPIMERFPRYLIAPYGVWLVITMPGVLFLLCWRQSKKTDYRIV